MRPALNLGHQSALNHNKMMLQSDSRSGLISKSGKLSERQLGMKVTGLSQLRRVWDIPQSAKPLSESASMKAAVILLPGLNRDRDMIAALTKISGRPPVTIWQTETEIADDIDLIVVPGGFSYGDYLRCGAIAARMPVLQAVREKAERGTRVIGVCNGFQILVECGLLPGALMRNASLKFVCREVKLEVTNANTVFTSNYSQGQIIRCPVAHHDGNYFADDATLQALEDNGQVVFRYAESTNPNGSINDIAGIINKNGNVLGLMPHPENLIEAAHGGDDGRALFETALEIAA